MNENSHLVPSSVRWTLQALRDVSRRSKLFDLGGNEVFAIPHLFCPLFWHLEGPENGGHGRPCPVWKLYLEPDTLDLRIQLKRVQAEFTAKATLLVAAEGRDRIELVVAVYPYCTGA